MSAEKQMMYTKFGNKETGERNQPGAPAKLDGGREFRGFSASNHKTLTNSTNAMLWLAKEVTNGEDGWYVKRVGKVTTIYRPDNTAAAHVNESNLHELADKIDEVVRPTAAAAVPPTAAAAAAAVPKINLAGLIDADVMTDEEEKDAGDDASSDDDLQIISKDLGGLNIGGEKVTLSSKMNKHVKNLPGSTEVKDILDYLGWFALVGKDGETLSEKEKTYVTTLLERNRVEKRKDLNDASPVNDMFKKFCKMHLMNEFHKKPLVIDDVPVTDENMKRTFCEVISGYMYESMYLKHVNGGKLNSETLNAFKKFRMWSEVVCTSPLVLAHYRKKASGAALSAANRDATQKPSRAMSVGMRPTASYMPSASQAFTTAAPTGSFMPVQTVSGVTTTKKTKRRKEGGEEGYGEASSSMMMAH